jgi:phage tail sheath protein FI
LEDFLRTLWQQGAFQGQNPRDAYFVKCDRETTTQADINQDKVNLLIGFAPLRPAEFIVLHVTQPARKP